jgi:hypothetical protein
LWLDDGVEWFDVIPCLTRIPKTSTMASKLCIQLHSFPKDVFESIQKTQIVTGQDRVVLNKLEVDLRTLVSSIADNFVYTMQQYYCDFSAAHFEGRNTAVFFCRGRSS